MAAPRGDEVLHRGGSLVAEPDHPCSFASDVLAVQSDHAHNLSLQKSLDFAIAADRRVRPILTSLGMGTDSAMAAQRWIKIT